MYTLRRAALDAMRIESVLSPRLAQREKDRKERKFFFFLPFLSFVFVIFFSFTAADHWLFVAVFSLLSVRVCSVGSGPWERATTQPPPALDPLTQHGQMSHI